MLSNRACPPLQVAAQRLAVDPASCLVVEDSTIGLAAALGAGMRCLVTYTDSTRSQARPQGCTGLGHAGGCEHCTVSGFGWDWLGLGSGPGRASSDFLTHHPPPLQDFAGADTVVASLEGVTFADLAGGRLAGQDDRVAAATAAAQ